MQNTVSLTLLRDAACAVRLAQEADALLRAAERRGINLGVRGKKLAEAVEVFRKNHVS